jgi:cytidylate kinase
VLRRDADDSTVARFVDAAEGVDIVDSSHHSIDQTVATVLDLVFRRAGVAPA